MNTTSGVMRERQLKDLLTALDDAREDLDELRECLRDLDELTLDDIERWRIAVIESAEIVGGLLEP